MIQRRIRETRTLLLGLLATLTAGCELQEITVAESQDIVIAEVFLQVGQGANRITGFLHRSEDGGRGGTGEVPGADIRLIIDRRGLSIPLLEGRIDECLVPMEDGHNQVGGTCYVAPPLEELLLSAGDSVRLIIGLPDGSQMRGETVVPGAFDIISPSTSQCILGALETVDIQWTASDGTWAYIAETVITGLRDLLPDEIEVDDPLNLFGLAISATDTTIAFPSEFGIFERFDLDRGLALLLQDGLPSGVDASIVVGATDRNWVNWVRGGNFNPSGLVRVPSIEGAGTGVFASVVRRTVHIETGVNPALSPCTTAGGS